jgi:hypothetical protein
MGGVVGSLSVKEGTDEVGSKKVRYYNDGEREGKECRK